MKRLHSIPEGSRPAVNQVACPAPRARVGCGPFSVALPLILALAAGATLGPVRARGEVPDSEAGSMAALAPENARLRAEIEAIRGEERRRDRRLEILEREAEAERRYRESDRKYLEGARPDPDLLRQDAEEDIHKSLIDRRVEELERAADLQRDVAAARLGISREEYEKAMRDRFRDSYYGGPWK